MECIQTQIDSSDILYALFMEENRDGTAHSKIVRYPDLMSGNGTVVVDTEGWVSAIWISARDVLHFVDFEGNMFALDDTTEVRDLEGVDLLGTTGLNGFGPEPQFVYGEDGHLFANIGGQWRRVNISGDETVYSVCRRDIESYGFCCEGGVVLQLDRQSIARLPTPTNVDLHGIAALDTETVLAVGDLGAAYLVGGSDLTEVSIDIGGFQDTVNFNGTIFASAQTDGMFLFDPATGEFETVFDGRCYSISSNARHVVSHGGRQAHIFDGATWATVDLKS